MGEGIREFDGNVGSKPMDLLGGFKCAGCGWMCQFTRQGIPEKRSSVKKERCPELYSTAWNLYELPLPYGSNDVTTKDKVMSWTVAGSPVDIGPWLYNQWNHLKRELHEGFSKSTNCVFIIITINSRMHWKRNYRYIQISDHLAAKILAGRNHLVLIIMDIAEGKV